jgi:RNA polymerase sigma factor (sigma-70 family)
VVESVLELLAKDHKHWISLLLNMGCNPSVAEDIVQEMYIKVYKYVEEYKKNIMYENEINYFFIYVTLKNMYMDYHRQKSKVDTIPYYDLSIEDESSSEDEKSIDDIYDKHLSIQEWYNDDLYLELLEKEEITEAEYTKEELGKYYSRRIFKEVFLDKMKVAELSRSTNITYWSLRNTIKIIKKEIRKYYETRGLS